MDNIVAQIQTLSEKFSASYDPALENDLRLLRRNTAQAWLEADEQSLPQLMAGEFGKAHHALLSCLNGLILDDDDLTFVQPLIKNIKISWPSTDSTRYMLAAMLYLGPHEMPLKHDFFSVSDWFMDDFLSFLLRPPALFKTVGEEKYYLGYMEGLLGYVHDLVTGPLFPKSGNFPEVFLNRLNLIQSYFNEENLMKIFRMRAQIAEAVLYHQGHHLDVVFPRHDMKNKKIRVGFLINAILDHTESFFALAHMIGLPRDSMEIFLYTLVTSNHPLEQQAKKNVDYHISLEGLSLGDQVTNIRNDDLDVLIVATNVAAVTTPMFLLSMHRLARIQVANMASPVTTGIRNIDFFLSSEKNEPAPSPQAQYTEKLIQLPGALNYFAYQYHDVSPAINVDREKLGIAIDTVVLFSGANYYKIVPELFSSWAKILAATRNTVLVLMPFNQNWDSQYPRGVFLARLMKELKDQGVGQDRLIILNPVPTRADVQEIVKLADIYLDGFPFAGSCSMFDPVQNSIPAVVRAGKTARSKHGATILSMIGLEALVAKNEDEYVVRAIKLVSDSKYRNTEKQRFRKAIEDGNPMLDVKNLGMRVGTAITSLVESSRTDEDKMFAQDAEALLSEIGILARDITADKPFAAGLTDSQWIHMLFLPYFKSVNDMDSHPHMVDVGACYGEISLPFLQAGWTADLFEPDPECFAKVKQNLNKFGNRFRCHAVAITPEDCEKVSFYKAQCDGLSGLSASPYGQTKQMVSVPGVRLGNYLKNIGVRHVDMLKIDAEGWDLDVLKTHDFTALPPKLIFIEVNTAFKRQTLEQIRDHLEWMSDIGYESLVLEYQDDGNFKNGVWEYRLGALQLGRHLSTKNGKLMSNILFFRKNDKAFMVALIQLLRSLTSK